VRHVVEKLVQRSALPIERAPLAVTMLAGLLRWLWEIQNLVAVEKQIIEGQTRVAELALASLLANGSPEAPWMQLVSGYSERIGGWLGALKELPYDEKLYPAIYKAIERIKSDAQARLARVRSEHPDRVPDAITFLMGTLIQINSYSYIDGSVPEHICEKLKEAHHELGGKAEGCLSPWLMEGFARESAMDELQRWCYGIAGGAVARG
jgi:hypothetical protein